MSDGLLLAGRLRRLVATLIDAILVPSLTLVLVMIAGVVEDAEDYVDYWWIVWVLLLAVVSYLLLNGYGLWRRGQTLGQAGDGDRHRARGRGDAMVGTVARRRRCGS